MGTEAPTFESLCREHQIDATPMARLCELFWVAGSRKALEEADKLADALMDLLEDSQHAEHEDCEDGGYCPVRDGRRALARYQAIRALAGKE